MALEDPEPFVANLAIRELANLGDPSALSSIWARTKVPPDPALCDGLRYALLKLHDDPKRAVPFLVEQASSKGLGFAAAPLRTYVPPLTNEQRATLLKSTPLLREGGGDGSKSTDIGYLLASLPLDGVKDREFLMKLFPAPNAYGHVAFPETLRNLETPDPFVTWLLESPVFYRREQLGGCDTFAEYVAAFLNAAPNRLLTKELFLDVLSHQQPDSSCIGEAFLALAIIAVRTSDATALNAPVDGPGIPAGRTVRDCLAGAIHSHGRDRVPRSLIPILAEYAPTSKDDTTWEAVSDRSVAVSIALYARVDHTALDLLRLPEAIDVFPSRTVRPERQAFAESDDELAAEDRISAVRFAGGLGCRLLGEQFRLMKSWPKDLRSSELGEVIYDCRGQIALDSLTLIRFLSAADSDEMVPGLAMLAKATAVPHPGTRDQIQKLLQRADGTARMDLIEAFIKAGGELDAIVAPLRAAINDHLKDAIFANGAVEFLTQHEASLSEQGIKWIRNDALATLNRSRVSSRGSYRAAEEIQKVLATLRARLTRDEALGLINAVVTQHGNRDVDEPMTRFQVTFLSGGDRDATTAALWLLGPTPPWPARDDLTARREILRATTAVLKLPGLADALRGRISSVIRSCVSDCQWDEGDLTQLRATESWLARTNLTTALPTVRGAIAQVERQGWVSQIWTTARAIVFGHAAIWAIVLLYYPRWPFLQRLVLQNAWVTKGMGFGYVHVLVTTVPWLKRRLLEPYRAALGADGDLVAFDTATYFGARFVVPVSKVTAPPEPSATRICLDALMQIRGLAVIVAESGAGKTTLMRALARAGADISLFLRAASCEGGVEAAIKQRMPPGLGDDSLMLGLLQGRGVTVYVDGLNEASPQAREKIRIFLERTRGKAFVSTQPIRWLPPQGVSLFRLCPVPDSDVYQFLALQGRSDEKGSNENYAARCEAFLARLPVPRPTWIQEILGSPINLSVVATLTAKGVSVGLVELADIEQFRYQEMEGEYRRQNNGDAFPLDHFVTAAYDALRGEHTRLPEGERAALDCMADFKMITRWQQDDGVTWRFRHEHVATFFAIGLFLGVSGEKRRTEHLQDTRFRHLILTLATRLPLDEATQLGKDINAACALGEDANFSVAYHERLYARS